ncbi:hypothetical protein KUCAC02_009050 [Chaenocephalus aceratus]|uniref:Uncharacterized protein n=1 Tax=Chaenocephalus aceratus TaxID=36190 RepID=A0ACB9WTU0_CHAAC|nr:hypothetical protein KUCAC02_009050 [Chaenocephalus aceratus]
MDFMTDRDVQKECDELRQRMGDMVRRWTSPKHCRTTFSTNHDEQLKAQASSKHTVQEAQTISSPVETRSAFSLRKEFLTTKGIHRTKTEVLNKVGHALHAYEPLYKQVTHSPKVQGLARKLGLVSPVILQSMFIFKQPGIGGEVTPHQDATFLHTEPLGRVMGLWIALEDATENNGCLWFIPHSHNSGISRRMVRTPKGTYPMTDFTGREQTYNEQKFSRSVVLIDGEVVHRSSENTSEDSRHVYTFHIMESQDTRWSPENWLQPTEELPFPQLYTK